MGKSGVFVKSKNVSHYPDPPFYPVRESRRGRTKSLKN